MVLKNRNTLLSCILFLVTGSLYAQQDTSTINRAHYMEEQTIERFVAKEKDLILSGGKDSKLHVYQTTDEQELLILTRPSSQIDYTDPLLPILAQRMLLTVQDPAHAGVGIAAPQVGINRKAIWVQRFDKTGEPFEFYINPTITWRSQLMRQGAEGCLSIPDRKETIKRSYAIQIQYQNKKGQLITEIVEGFTAVIFQHEIDHLEGILYPDRLYEQSEAGYIELNEKIPFSLQIQQKNILP